MARKQTLFDRAGLLVERYRTFLAAPPRSGRERAVYDAWKVAIQPRSRRMLGRVERLADAAHWEYDAARRPVRLRASLWTTTVRDAAALYTELFGALHQHESVRIVWRPKLHFGAVKGTHAEIKTAKDQAKQRAAETKALEAAASARMKAAKKTLQDVLDGLERLRSALRAAIEETRHLVAALMEAEELRLQARIRELSEGTSEREHAEDLLVDLAQGRLNAKRYGEAKPAGYGSLLRRQWLRPRARLVRLLEGHLS